MKKFIAPLLVGAALTSAFAADDLAKEVAALKAQMAELKNAQTKINIDALRQQVSEIKAHDAGDNIKWTVDFRTAYDVVDYKIGAGMGSSGVFNPGLGAAGMFGMFTPVAKSTADNALWSNKLILGMASQPADNLVFKGALGVYKTFGQSSFNTAQNSMFQNFDWYGTQKQNDATIRLREAYFLYFGDMGDVHYSASFGRRPSVDGFMTNLRADNENPSSPVGHNINMEFDGASFKFDLDKLTGISGMYVKLCLGRGFSDTTGMYSQDMSTGGFNPPYVTAGANGNMDLAGLLVQFYDDGQYKVMANVFKGWNMMDIGNDIVFDMTDPTDMTYTMASNGFHDVGDLTGASLSLQVNGIGDGISDFLDDSVFFISYAVSKTDPTNKITNRFLDTDGNDLSSMLMPMLGSLTPQQIADFMGQGMLGSGDKETGSSIYTGFQFPGFMQGQRVGLEYNHGSKYWRSFTYGEDTLAGSKLATRGNAYEIYYTMPIVGKNLTAQLSYVYMDYDYAGSDMFFGQTGNTAGLLGAMPYVEKAYNIHASIRYRY